MKATPDQIKEAYKKAKEGAEQEFKSTGKEGKMKEKEEPLKLLGEKLKSGEITQEEFQTQSMALLGPEVN